MWGNYCEKVSNEGQHSLGKTLQKEAEANKIDLPAPKGKFPIISLSPEEEKELARFVWPKDLDFKVSPDLANSKIAFAVLVENLCSGSEDTKAEFLAKMENVPCNPDKPRPTPFDDLDLNLLWGDPSEDDSGPLKVSGHHQRNNET